MMIEWRGHGLGLLAALALTSGCVGELSGSDDAPDMAPGEGADMAATPQDMTPAPAQDMRQEPAPEDMRQEPAPEDMGGEEPARDMGGGEEPPDMGEEPPPPPQCPTSGPAYLHGDVWYFWHNGRVACDAQHRWLWLCEQRLGAGSCAIERGYYEDCLNAGPYYGPATNCDDCTPAPHIPNWGVCQPQHFPEKRDDRRPDQGGNPCDTRNFDYDALRTSDRRYGLDWWGAGHTAARHMTLKIYDQGQDPLANEGQGDALAVLSTHPGEHEAFMDGRSNHPYAGSARQRAGCLPSLEGDNEQPMPGQNFGAFAWVEVPTDRPVTMAISWHGPVGGDVGLQCLTGKYFFPGDFGAHGVDGKPWFVSSPCWDITSNFQFEPGAHYVIDHMGLRKLDGCDGPPAHILDVVAPSERAGFADGSCNPPR